MNDERVDGKDLMDRLAVGLLDAVKALTLAELHALDDAIAGHTTSNVWYLSYELGPIVRDLVSKPRECALQRGHPMTTPDDTLAAAREAKDLGEKATPGPMKPQRFAEPTWTVARTRDGKGPALLMQTIGGNDEANARFYAHAGTHYAAIAAALLAAEAEGERVRADVEGLKAELASEQEAHSLIASICFGAGAESSDGTSVAAVKSLLGIVASLRAALARREHHTAETES